MAAAGRNRSMESFEGNATSPHQAPIDFTHSRLRLGRSRLKDRATTVCQRCNNGWMGGIQGQVSSRLFSLFATGVGELDTQDQHLLSKWAVMTALVIQQHRFSPSPLEQLRRRFFANREDLSSYAVWVANSADPAEAAQFFRLNLVAGSATPAWVQFVVGHLHFICGLGTSFSQPALFDELGAAQINPTSDDVINFPRNWRSESISITTLGVGIAAAIDGQEHFSSDEALESFAGRLFPWLEL